MKRFIILAVAILVCATQLRAQLISVLTPNSGTPGQSADVMIRGINTHFQSGLSEADFGPGITVQKLTVFNALTSTATIQVSQNAIPGPRTVRVTTGAEQAEMVQGFEVFSGVGNFTANIEIIPIETISLADLDLTRPQSAPVLFFVNIYNDATAKNVRVTVDLQSQTRGNIGKLILNSRALNSNQYLRITNRDFNDLSLNGGSGNQFLNEVQALGTFPPDNYTFSLEVRDQNNNLLGADAGNTVITNTRVNPELIAPGAPFSLQLEEVYTPFPLFQWFGQMDRFDFALYELREGQSPEEAVRTLAVFRKTDLTSNNFLYPVYAEKLIPGKSYAWQVQGKISGASGQQYFPSSVFRFRYSGAGTPVTTEVPAVASIQLMPLEIELEPGAVFKFNALFFDSENNPLTNVSPQWTLSSPKGTISADGLLTAGTQPGTFAVIVKSGSTTEYATVTIRSKQPAAQVNVAEWMIDGLIDQLFGLPK